MNVIPGIAGSKQIQFMCIDCKKKIATDAIAMGYILMPYYFQPSWLSLLNSFDSSVEVNIICNKCIKLDRHKTELNLTSTVYKAYSLIMKKEKDVYSRILIEFEQHISNYENKDFENILSKFSLEQFLKANAKFSDKLKRKTPKFLSQKVKKIITNYLSQEQDVIELFSEKAQFRKLAEKNKLFPMKECLDNKKIIPAMVKFCFDNASQDADFYLIFDEGQSDFINAYIKQIGFKSIDIESNDLDVENRMLGILSKRFISLYKEN